MTTGTPRILFVNRFYYPDHSATAQILTDLAEALAARGWNVEVIASRMRYDDAAAVLAKRETHAGVAIRRVATTRFGRAGIAGRAVDYLSFYIASFLAVLGDARRGDIVVAKTDPPLLGTVIGMAAWLRGARIVNWLQDLYPEIAAELGIESLRGPTGKLLTALRNRSLRRAALNVAIGERMAERLAAAGVPGERVVMRPNWSDDEGVRPLARGAVPLRAEWGLEGKFVIGYSGNLGRAHETETLIGAAKLLRARGDLAFLMIGGGHESRKLAERVADEGLTDLFRFHPYQPRERLGESLGAADVHWLSLRPEMEGLIVPSKFYGIAAAGRPVIAVSDPDGEIGRIVTRHDCGIAVVPGDSAAMAAAITALSTDPARLDRMGANARALLERDYTRAIAFDRWHWTFADLSAGRAPA
jgi:glycosyltransferase involved in cell wall biosynthesis